MASNRNTYQRRFVPFAKMNMQKIPSELHNRFSLLFSDNAICVLNSKQLWFREYMCGDLFREETERESEKKTGMTCNGHVLSLT